MARNRTNSYEERREQIIEGALKVFSEKGFEAASNRDIASAAGIGSPALIYHYFKDKDDLLRSAVLHKMPLVEIAAHPDLLMEMPLREALEHLARNYLKVMDRPEVTQLLRLLIGEAVKRPEFARLWAESSINRVSPVIADYFQKQIDLGNMRKSDPILATVRFGGPLFGFVMMRIVLQLPMIELFDREMVIQNMVENFLYGALPEEKR